MVSMDTDVEELLSLVVSTGVQLDEQVVKLTQMSDLVVKGIEQAAEDLKRETDEAIWQEGVLRHVPIVGSLYNWISPLQKPQIKGRFLSLNEGKLQSTEVVYKHHGMIDQKNPAAATRRNQDEYGHPGGDEQTAAAIADSQSSGAVEEREEVTECPDEASNGTAVAATTKTKEMIDDETVAAAAAV